MVGKPLRGHKNYVYCVTYSPDGQKIVSGSQDGTVHVWNADNGTPIGKPLTGHRRVVHSVVFSPNGKFVISGSWDETVRIWNSQTGEVAVLARCLP